MQAEVRTTASDPLPRGRGWNKFVVPSYNWGVTGGTVVVDCCWRYRLKGRLGCNTFFSSLDNTQNKILIWVNISPHCILHTHRHHPSAVSACFCPSFYRCICLTDPFVWHSSAPFQLSHRQTQDSGTRWERFTPSLSYQTCKQTFFSTSSHEHMARNCKLKLNYTCAHAHIHKEMRRLLNPIFCSLRVCVCVLFFHDVQLALQAYSITDSRLTNPSCFNFFYVCYLLPLSLFFYHSVSQT